jgi:hypothetical protein
MGAPAPWQERANPVPVALDSALKLAANGFPAFPCLTNKRPACPHGFKDASTDPDKLRNLWRACPGTLVGVPTGEASGIFVVDIDSARHPEAEEWLECHSPQLPETRLHRTQSDGIHLLFKHRAGLKNSTSKLATGVDTRGEGGYIIWWPLMLGLRFDHEFVPLADVPQWIIEELNPPAKVIPFPARPNVLGAYKNAPGRVQGIIAAVSRAREGERNCITYWAACCIRDMLIARELNSNDGNNAFAALYEAASRLGLSALEIKRTIASATGKAP